MMKISHINQDRIAIDFHPVTNQPINLQWFRGANRYNNGATRYGRKYRFRYIISMAKEAKQDASRLSKSNDLLSKVAVADEKPILMLTMLPV